MINLVLCHKWTYFPSDRDGNTLLWQDSNLSVKFPSAVYIVKWMTMESLLDIRAGPSTFGMLLVCGPPVSTTSKIVCASYFPIPIHEHEILDPYNLEWESVKRRDMGQSSWLANQRYISLLTFLESTMYIYKSKLISLLLAHLESIVWVYRFKLILHYLKPKLHPFFFHFFRAITYTTPGGPALRLSGAKLNWKLKSGKKKEPKQLLWVCNPFIKQPTQGQGNW